MKLPKIHALTNIKGVFLVVKGRRTVRIQEPDRIVWISHRASPSNTYNSANSYGDIRYLSQNTLAGKVNQFRDKTITRRFRKKLQASGPDDLVLLSGYGSLQVLACLAFKEIHGHVNVLLYNQRTRKYEIRKNFGQ
jgi:predicted LPLAT superfamily acyltransferase